MEDFQAIRQEVGWAKAGINEAIIEFRRFAEQNTPFSTLDEVDPGTGHRLIKVKLVKEPSGMIPNLMRTSIKDIKDSFDRSLHTACGILGSREIKVNYPWSDTVVGLRKILRKWAQKERTRVPLSLVREILRQKPYYDNQNRASPRNIVREMAKVANFKHNAGISCEVAPSGIQVNYPDEGVVRSMGTWNREKKEQLVFELSSNLFDYTPRIGTYFNVFFYRGKDMMTVPAFTCALLFADAAEATVNGFEAACQRALGPK